jgi:hypothetical protein
VRLAVQNPTGDRSGPCGAPGHLCGAWWQTDREGIAPHLRAQSSCSTAHPVSRPLDDPIDGRAQPPSRLPLALIAGSRRRYNQPQCLIRVSAGSISAF